MFGSSVKQSSAQASGAAYSGMGAFSPVNRVGISRPLVDLTDPASIGGVVVLAGAAWLAWKRIK